MLIVDPKNAKIPQPNKTCSVLFGIIMLIASWICWNNATSVYTEAPMHWTKAALITGFSGFFLLFPAVAQYLWRLVRRMIRDIFYEATQGIKTAEHSSKKIKSIKDKKGIDGHL